MAEQSMFWPTDGTGDGTSGGYTDARLKTIWNAALGNGVLQYLNNLAATGTGTSTLAVNTGAALVEGYLYENTASASIDTSGLGSATYGLYVIANEDTISLAVSRSVAGTTVAAKATRLALNSTTPTQPYIKIATVATSGGSITSITAENNRYASSRVKTSGTSTLATGARTTNQAVPFNTNMVGTYTAATDSIYVSVNATSGAFTVLESGVYLVWTQYSITYHATGTRLFSYRVNNAIVQETVIEFAPTAIGNVNNRNLHSYVASYSAGDTLAFNVWQNSGVSLNLLLHTTMARLG